MHFVRKYKAMNPMLIVTKLKLKKLVILKVKFEGFSHIISKLRI